MKNIINALQAHTGVSDYKINIHSKESCELFFVKGALETLRRTDTCDKEVTVYADHDGCKGDAQFFVYPSTTEAQLQALTAEAVEKALLIANPTYTLPAGEDGSFRVASNLEDKSLSVLCQEIADAVFAGDTVENASLNSVEIFVNKHTDRILNSRGMDKTQVRYDAMVEAIPTFNGKEQSVELYEQYSFSSFDANTLTQRIHQKLEEARARCEATVPAQKLSCPVVLRELELATLMRSIASDLSYSRVYTHANLFKEGDAVQKAPTGDILGITMAGQVQGSVRSRCFDSDGLALGSQRIVEGGKVVSYFGDNRFGQYLGKAPTGALPCLDADAGTAAAEAFTAEGVLEVVSMSGLQVDFFNDYIGGEVRLAYLHKAGDIVPVTGISISGKLSQVLETIGLSQNKTVCGGYFGPEKAILQDMNIF